MLDTLYLDTKFYETRMIETINFKITPRDKYIMNQFVSKLNIENKTSWITSLIEAEIKDKIDSGFVEIH